MNLIVVRFISTKYINSALKLVFNIYPSRFDMDYDDEVLYVYEIQVEKGFRRKGLGR